MKKSSKNRKAPQWHRQLPARERAELRDLNERLDRLRKVAAPIVQRIRFLRNKAGAPARPKRVVRAVPAPPVQPSLF